MLQRDGHPTAPGEALAAYGRIFKSLHILAYIDADEAYRRDIKHIRNLQEGRHDLARTICHGKKGELFHRYERGLENQLGVLGLVLNCVVLWTTVYLNAAITHLRAQGYPVREEDAARLSPFVRKHLGVHGTYSFALPDLEPGASSATPTPPMTMRSDVLLMLSAQTPDPGTLTRVRRRPWPGRPEVAARGRSKALPRPRRIGRGRTEPPRCWLAGHLARQRRIESATAATPAQMVGSDAMRSRAAGRAAH